MFRTAPLLIIRNSSLYTQQQYMSYRFTDSLRAGSGQLSTNLYDIYHCCVYSKKTHHDGQRNCPKHVEFYFKNKFEKLVYLVGFIIRIYHDARSPERQIWKQLDRKCYTALTLHILLRSKWPSFIIQYTYIGSTHIEDNSFKQGS